MSRIQDYKLDHRCHAVGCQVPVKPEFLMCFHHWKLVPGNLQRKVLKTYRKGQCEDQMPSRPWLEAARQAISAVREKEKGRMPPGERFPFELRENLDHFRTL